MAKDEQERLAKVAIEKARIGAQVPIAMAIVTANADAFVQRLTAEGELLREIVELVKPVLPSLCSSIVVANGWGVLQGIRWRETPLYLQDDGRFIRPHGKGSRDYPGWREVAEHVPADELAALLSDALDRLIHGRKSTRTEEAAARAKKLRALAVLLREL